MAIKSTENVKSKLTFEREAQSQGVLIKGYNTDNGIFNASEFMEKLLNKHQNIRFIGVSESHKNGSSERAIKMIVTTERNILMHAALRCPEDTFYTNICPMAMDYAIWVYNRIPRMQSGLSAIEIWSRSRFYPVPETLRNFHVWDCPTYFLELKYQKPGVNIPNWAPRSRRGVNIGFRKMHSTQVGLVLNLSTGSILPQYHVMFNGMFSTVVSNTDVYPEVWIRLVTSRN